MPTETKVDPTKMSLVELQKYAREHGIDTYAKTKKDILLDLGVTDRPDVIIFERPMTSEKLQEIKDSKWMIPKNTIIPKKDAEKWLKIIEQNPLAFNGLDLTNDKAEIVHVLSRDIKCACGAKFSIPPDTDVAYCPGIKETSVVQGRRVTTSHCMPDGRRRKYIWHEVPE